MKNASVDLAVMCLSLMGTNYPDFIREANRVLKPSALLKIAEVKSRFTSIDAFVKLLRELGFQLIEKVTLKKRCPNSEGASEQSSLAHLL